MSNEIFAIAIVAVTTAGAVTFFRGWVLMQRYFAKEKAAKAAANRNTGKQS